MKNTKSLTLALLFAFISMASCVEAQTYTVLGNFVGFNGGAPFYGTMAQARNGNYYGATTVGGKNGFGAVFELISTGKLNTISGTAFALCPDAPTD